MPYTGRLEATPLLDIIQIIAYSQQSGLLSIKGPKSKGLIVFQKGDIVCAYSPSALSLLVKAAKERDPAGRLALRRIQVLDALRELFALPEGDYRFVKRAEPIGELEGLDINAFYESGALNTGDLLLVLEKAMDEQPSHTSEALPSVPSRGEATRREARPRLKSDGPETREHPRFGPIVIQATLEHSDKTVPGYLTNLSQGGTFFHADELPEADIECELGFELPWSLGECRARAEVAWVRSEGPDTKKGAGLRFLQFSPDSKNRIAAYLERFQALAEDVDFEA